MYYKDIQHIKDADFRRLVGVNRAVFDQMVSVVAEYKEQHRKHKTSGRPSKLSTADQVLVMLCITGNTALSFM